MTVWTFGIDPGESCGLAVLRNGEIYRQSQGRPVDIMHEYTSDLDDAYTTGASIVVAYERYVDLGQRGHRSAQPAAQQIIGTVGFYAQLHGAEIRAQAPADAKKFAPNRRLRQLGLYVSAFDLDLPDADDANDATRHALFALAQCHATIYARLYAAPRL